MEVKRIAIMASYDWSLRHAMAEFVDFLDPVISHRRKKYKLELTRILAKPVRVGTDLHQDADLIVDRTTHWDEFYRNWSYQAMNSGVQMINNTYTFDSYNKHTTYDVMARAMHPSDRFPVTVLLPCFGPVLPNHFAQERWEAEMEARVKHTRYGWDPNRRTFDERKFRQDLADYDNFVPKAMRMRSEFYPATDYLREAMEKHFDNKFPVFLKKTSGGGGSDVHKIDNLQELYEHYDRTGGRSFHLQEAILDYDVFIRCMAIGPMVLPMVFQPDAPLHEHYSPEKPSLAPDIYARLANYVRFINSYHRWTYNSFETLIRDGQILPIDFANACPDSHLTSLHVHFPWVIVSLVKWLAFCAVTGKDLRMDMEHMRYLTVLDDPKRTQLQKYEFCAKASDEYFEAEAFEEFCHKNFKGIEERMVEFYDKMFLEIIEHAIEWSDFPKAEHPYFVDRYKSLMDDVFRKNAERYLTTYVAP